MEGLVDHPSPARIREAPSGSSRSQPRDGRGFEASRGGALARAASTGSLPPAMSLPGTADAELDRYGREIRSGQLDEQIALAGTTVVVHVVVSATLTCFFWNLAPNAYLAGLTGVVLSAMLGYAGVAWFYRRRTSTPALVDACHRTMSVLVLVLALAWSTMPLALYGPADPEHRTLVVAICAGLIASTYVFGAIPNLSWIFAIPVGAGSFLALVLRREPASDMLALLLTVYLGFVLFSSGRLTRLAIQRILARLRVEEQNETIGLLLDDFEESASDWLWETDAVGRLQYVSERVAQVAGKPVAVLHRAPFASLFGTWRGGRDEGVGEIVRLVRERVAFRNHVVEVEIADPRGGDGTEEASPRCWRLSGKPVHDRNGRFLGFRGVGSDITEARRFEARIAYLASFDHLTGLANRALFHERATEECGRALQLDRPCALLYLDLDGFKSVNDTFGHALGDLLLKEVAGRLVAVAGDAALVSRLGGDEFAILRPGAGQAEAVALAQTLLGAISAPYLIDGLHAKVGVTIGIALAPRDAATPQDLLGKADLALYRGKGGGKGTVAVFESALEASVRVRRELEGDLKAAIENGELSLHYQPLVAVEDGRVRSFEALLRWIKPGRGPISPADFVPVAEASGLIPAIGRWVLREACLEAASWPPDVRIAVNLSPTQFRNVDLVPDVVAALTASGLAADRLELEVTESVFFEMSAATVANLRDLRSLGVRIALDDFGTGYSSLSYLIKFPVDKIKIDRSFIMDMETRHECLAIVEAILAMARKLALTVTAEGVETPEQFRMLRRSRCDDIQGFLFSPARPAGEVRNLIETLPRLFPDIVSPPVGLEALAG